MIVIIIVCEIQEKEVLDDIVQHICIQLNMPIIPM